MPVKLFFFDTNSYGVQAMVMAESLEEAYKYLRGTNDNYKEKPEWDRHYHAKMIDDMVNSRNGYSVDEMGLGEVVFTEVS